SRLGRGKRIDRVEDVLALGDDLEVKVDDIDQNGKLSLSLVGDEPGGGDDNAGARAGGDREERGSRGGDRRDRGDRGDRDDRGSRASRETASFEAFWEEQAKEEFGDLGPADEAPASSGGDRRGGSRSRSGGSRRGPRR
ncbi:MAG: polyribonucleotide nucleotidyltransferase, partial [Acidimicrobiia bacterium]